MNKLLKYGVKKNDQDIILPNPENASNKDIEFDKIKTTNVNILLNRVRLDKKRTLKKRIIFVLILVTIISSLAVYFVI